MFPWDDVDMGISCREIAIQPDDVLDMLSLRFLGINKLSCIATLI